MLQRNHLDLFVFRSTFVSMLKSIGFWGVKTAKVPDSMVPISRLYVRAGMIPPDDEDVLEDDRILPLFLIDSIDLVLGDIISSHADEARRAGQLKPLPQSNAQPSPYVDEINEGLKAAMLTGRITVTNVFLSRLIFNIHKILGDEIEQSYKQLRLQGAISYAALDYKWQERDPFEPARPEGDTRQWLSEWGTREASQEAMLLSFFIKSVVRENKVVGMKQGGMVCKAKDEVENFWPAEGPLSFPSWD
jgi:hypothetical protein